MSDYETFIALAPFLVYVAALTAGVGIAHYMLVKQIRKEEEQRVMRIRKTVEDLKNTR